MTYTKHLQREMKEMEGKQLTTEKGQKVEFRIELIPGDMKWVAWVSGELNNASTYFSPYANVNQTNKKTINGSIGGKDSTWQPWEYKSRCDKVKKVEEHKKKLKDPNGKQRSDVTKFIAKQKSRQEFIPLLGKYVDCIKAEPLHNTNNGWQRWFVVAMDIAMQYTDKSQLKSAVVLSDLPVASPICVFLKCITEITKAGRLAHAIERWFCDGRKKNQPFSYRFTGQESKCMSWFNAPLLQSLLSIQNLTKGSELKIHSLAFIALNLRDAASIYSRVNIKEEEVLKLKNICNDYFTANFLFIGEISPTIWTIGE